VWLFGSACSDNDSRDIDILIVYDPGTLSVTNAIDFRRKLAEAIFAATRRPTDILLLSQDEFVQTAFLKRVDAIRI
jgi:predicted nucleotidyltransferase